MPSPTLPDDKGLGDWTPGPWRIGAEWPQFVAIYDARCIYIAHAETGAGGNWIGENQLGRAVAQANARLIAAAPELFEACSAWIEYLETDAPGSACDELRMLDAMRAALAKASGK